MSIRLMTEADLPRVTEIAWHGLEFDEINEGIVREKTVGARDYEHELNIVHEKDGRVVGFASGSVGRVVDGKQRGHVRLMAVDPAHRMAGVGSALLRELELRLMARGAAVVTIFDSPNNYFMPGVDFRYTEAYCFLLKHKYEVYRENHNLVCDLQPDAWPGLDAEVEKQRAEGVEIRRAVEADRAAVDALLEKHWPAWKDEVHGALENNPATLYLAFLDGECVAFSGYQGNNRALNWFGPMGTTDVLRGRGIGGILLRLCLRDMARQGWRTAIIPWVGPVRFYARYCGARLDRCFWAYRKEL